MSRSIIISLLWFQKTKVLPLKLHAVKILTNVPVGHKTDLSLFFQRPILNLTVSKRFLSGSV